MGYRTVAPEGRTTKETKMTAKIGDWNYVHHTNTPIAKGATRRAYHWFQRGQRVVVDNPAVAYLRGATGTVVALQTHAVVVQLDATPARGRYHDDQNCVRFDDRALSLEV
jgi:hypothetical protein